jgi:hypothetical protein
MDEQNTVDGQVSAETSAPESGTQSAEPIQADVSQAGAVPPEQSVPEWSPNYKVKAYDAEYEIPEDFRSYLNKENEEKFRKVFERSFAFDVMKEKLEKTRANNENLSKIKSEYDTISSRLGQASKFIQNNDFGSFFGLIGVDKTAVQKWMYDQLKQEELPPEQRAVYEKNNEYLQKQYELEQMLEQYKGELEGIKGQSQEIALAKRHQELDSVLNRPEISEVVKSFDAKLDQTGAFRNEVIQRAAFIAQSSGKDLSAEEAVNETLKVIAWNKANETSASGDRVLQPNGQKKPTLPSMQGKATSPVAQQVKSIDDLKKLRAQQVIIQN